MNTFKTTFILTVIFSLFLFVQNGNTQHLANGFFKGQDNGSVCLAYTWEQYSSFYFGDEKRNNIPGPYQNSEGGGKIATQTISAFINYGLGENLELALNIPYISQTGAGEAPPPQKESDLQDGSLFIKWRPFNIAMDNSNLSFIGSLGGTTPLSDYTADAPLSIGNHSTRLDGQVIMHYQHNTGFFADLQTGYSLRSNNVPNATLLGVKIGMALNKFFINGWSKTQISDSSAPDINPMEYPFYETRVNYTQVGAEAYYAINPSFGISVNYAQYVGGRNVGLASGISGGLIYNY